MPGNLSRRSVLVGGGSLGLATVGGLAVWQIASSTTTSAAPAMSATKPATTSGSPTTLATTSVTTPAAQIAATTASPPPVSASQQPQMTVTVNNAGVSPGQIFFTYDGGAGIAESDGRPLWSTSSSLSFANLQVQSYLGKDVLTWWQGDGNAGGGGTGLGTDILTTLSGTPAGTIGPSGTYHPDLHEFRITPQNTALITSYLTVPYDLSPVGGPSNGQLRNAYCEEVDIASGTVLHRWSAIDHVPLSDSHAQAPTEADIPYDYFHINSISVTPDDQLLISARNTCALYKIERTTGQLIWVLGGRSSSFVLVPDAVFGFQHHAVYEDEDTIRLFDDGSDGVSNWHDSRVIWIRPDTRTHTAALADSMTIPGIQTTAMGSAQRLANGNVFVSWGMTPRLSEFSPSGEVLFDATLTSPSYRGFKFQVY